MTAGQLLLVTTEADLQRMMVKAFEMALSNQRSPQPLSAATAAKHCKVRYAVLVAALRSGDLFGQFIPGGHGGRGEWRIRPSDLETWDSSRLRGHRA